MKSLKEKFRVFCFVFLKGHEQLISNLEYITVLFCINKLDYSQDELI